MLHDSAHLMPPFQVNKSHSLSVSFSLLDMSAKVEQGREGERGKREMVASKQACQLVGTGLIRREIVFLPFFRPFFCFSNRRLEPMAGCCLINDCLCVCVELT